MPPQIALPDNDVEQFALVLPRFLIHPNMEETWPSKDVSNLAYQVSTHRIVLASGQLARILAQPGVVASGEVELGNGFNAETATKVVLVSCILNNSRIRVS